MPQLAYNQVELIRTDLLTDAQPVRRKWRTSSREIAPYSFRESSIKHDLGRKDQRILRNVAGLSLRTFIAGMVNGNTPPTRPWFYLTTLNTDRARNTYAKRWLSSSAEALRRLMGLTNTYRILPMAYKDIGLFSNSAYAMLPHDRYGFYFFPFRAGTYAFSNNYFGEVDTFVRDFVLTVRQVVEQYGRLKETDHIDWSNIDPWIKALWESKHYQQQVVLSNLIVPNPNPRRMSPYAYDKLFQSYTWVQSTQASTSGSYASFGGAPADTGIGRRFLKVSGYDYFPVIVPRWEVLAEEDYGVGGPSEMALSFVQGLQSKEEFRMEGVAKLVRPPMIAPSDLRRHQSSILAGGITYVDEFRDRGQFRPAFQVDPKLGDLIITQNEDIEFIRSCYYEPLFLLLSSERPRSHVTKAEIQERVDEKTQALAPVLAQLDQDQNSKIIEIGMYIMASKGLLPEMPPELEEETIRPEYISVLARAAKSAQATGIEKAIDFTTSVATAAERPELKYIVKMEDAIRDYCESVGLDPNQVTTEEEYQKVVEAVQQGQAELQAQQRRAQESEVVKNLARAQKDSAA